MSSSPNLLEYLRSNPTVSVKQHKYDVAEKVPIRSERILFSRGPSFPALVLDTSADHVEENLFRRSLHSRILETNPGAFRRKKTKDGPIASMEEIAKMRDLLGTMHPYKDPEDIDKTHKYSSSRRLEIDKLERTNLEEYQFANMKPIEDFLQPNDVTSPRHTGYEHGHIRNLMKLDSYGPNNSRQNTRERQRSGGLLPPPNVDRYATLDATASHSLANGFSRRIGSPTSAASSRPSTAQSTNTSVSASFNDTFDNHFASATLRNHASPNHSRRSLSPANSHSPELRIAPSLRSLYQHRPVTPTLAPLELTMPASLRKETYKKGENRITMEERQNFDPFVKRKHYSESIIQRAKSTAERKRFHKEINNYVKAQQELASVERRKIRDFERHVSLAKFEP